VLGLTILATVVLMTTNAAELAAGIVFSTAGVTVPVIYSLVGGDSAKARLSNWKDWLNANNAAILAVPFLVFGVVLLSKGSGDLMG
jgi:hypothetical protein